MTELEQAIDDILGQVEAAGAQADLIVDEKESLSLKARAGELDEQAVSQSRIMGLRVVSQGRVGVAYSEAPDAEARQWLVEQAILNAQHNRVSDHEQIALRAEHLQTDDALLCPDSTLSPERRIDMLLSLEQQLAAQPQIRNVPYNGFSEQVSGRAVASTGGLRAHSRQRMNFLYAYALAAAEDTTAMAGHGEAARRGEALTVEPLVERIYQDATDLLQGKPVATGRYAVCFAPDTQHELFSAFSIAWSGKSACDGLSPWRDRVGQKVAHSALTLLDAPHLSEGFGYALFDAEGTPTAATTLIRAGELQTLIHNSATARELGVSNTGHAVRGPKSGLTVSAHQLSAMPGQATSAELLSGEVLWITQLQGVHSGANALSGDFSFGASGYLLRDGQRIQPVRGITVAGNFYQMLQQVEAIGAEQHWNWARSSFMPTLRFPNMAISG